MERGNRVEPRNLYSRSGYRNDEHYIYEQECRMKDFITGNWVDAIIYRDVKTNEIYVREKNDFLLKFKAVNESQI